MTWRGFLILGWSGFVLSCGKPTEVRVVAHLSTFGRAEFGAEVRAGVRGMRVTQAELQGGGTPTVGRSSFFSVGNADVTVDVSLQDELGAVSSGTYELQPVDGWGHDVIVRIASQDPAAGCFGCGSSVAFPLAPRAIVDPADSLWVYVGLDPRDPDIVF